MNEQETIQEIWDWQRKQEQDAFEKLHKDDDLIADIVDNLPLMAAIEKPEQTTQWLCCLISGGACENWRQDFPTDFNWDRLFFSANCQGWIYYENISDKTKRRLRTILENLREIRDASKQQAV